MRVNPPRHLRTFRHPPEIVYACIVESHIQVIEHVIDRAVLDIQMEQRLQCLKRGDAVWRVVTQEFPGMQPVLIGIRTYQRTELGGQWSISRGLLLDNHAGMTGWDIALAEHVPYQIVTGILRVPL